LAGFLMHHFAQIHAENAKPRNAMKIKAFSSGVIACWRVHVTWMAHEQ
jgi:hypothetical protein